VDRLIAARGRSAGCISTLDQIARQAAVQMASRRSARCTLAPQMPVDVERLSRFDRALWSAALGTAPPRSLHDTVAEAFAGDRREQVTVWTVLAEDNPARRLVIVGGEAIDAQAQMGAVGLLLVNDHAGPFVLSIWPTGEDGAFNLIGTVPVTDERWRRVERWVANAAPRVASFVLNEADFNGIAAALTEHGRVEVSRLAARVISDGSSYTRGWPESRRRIRPSYHRAVGEVEGVASIRTLTMHVGDSLSLHLRRQAGATFYRGNFRLFEEVVVAGLVASAGQRRRLLSGRERRSAEVPHSAIGVKLPSGLFADPDLIAELLESLSAQRGTGIAVLHRNPYLHVAVTDYLDGSNADLFVTSDDMVHIYPGFRASVGALTRLTEHLAERFAAREVADVPASSPPTTEELFTTG
jgi:hypothetical protein